SGQSRPRLSLHAQRRHYPQRLSRRPDRAAAEVVAIAAPPSSAIICVQLRRKMLFSEAYDATAARKASRKSRANLSKDIGVRPVTRSTSSEIAPAFPAS